MTTQYGPEARLTDVIAEVRAEHPRAVVVIVPAADSQAASLTLFADAFELPDWFGDNLDALEESLRDAVIALGRPVALVWDRVGALSDRDPHAAAAITDVLTDVSAQVPDLSVTVLNRR